MKRVTITFPESSAQVTPTRAAARFELLEARLHWHAGHFHPGDAVTLKPYEQFISQYDEFNHPDDAHAVSAVTQEVSTPAPTALLQAASVLDPAVVGKWSVNQKWPVQAIHSVYLPTGKILIFTYDEKINNVNLWDPVQNTFSKPASFNGYLYCSGHAMLEDGRVLLTGGKLGKVNGVPLGPRDAVIYDPFNDTWTVTPDMNAGRYYPTNTTLGNGDVLVVAGTDQNGKPNNVPQVYDPQSNTWRSLSTSKLVMPLYPMMFVLPDGRVYNVGPLQGTTIFDPSGTGTRVGGPRHVFGERGAGSAVMYDTGKILVLGGGSTPRSTAEVIDMTKASPAWRQVDTMDAARRNVNATILPDGNVFVTGGTSGPGANNTSTPVFITEMWNPGTEQFTQMAPMAVPRWYHSTALLLPDGRVMSAGGNGKISAEIYSPSYLFKGPRPVISAAPAAMGYGQTFNVQTASTNVTSAVLVRLGSATHSFNPDQRIARLQFTPTTGGLTVTSPANGNLAPPGFYMLFVLNAQGVPSIAKIVRLDGDVAAPTNNPSLNRNAAYAPPAKSTVVFSTGTPVHDLIADETALLA